MKCPYCNEATKVTNSRSHNNNHAVWRRRKCKSCDSIWSTDENYSLNTTHRVIYSDMTHFKAFSRDILYVSILDSLAHRKDRIEEAGAITDTIISKVLSLKSSNINIEQLKSIATDTLKSFDVVAASVYKATNSVN